MTSKELIFRDLHSALDLMALDGPLPQMPDLRPLEEGAVVFEDLEGTFRESLASAGGIVLDSVPDDTEDSFTVRGEFGVAENGCIWITSGGEEAFERRELFIHERLVVLLRRSNIVSNMHEAYRRLGEDPSVYGIFISGPSKTADIEQALVFGAHGPRALAVVLEQ